MCKKLHHNKNDPTRRHPKKLTENIRSSLVSTALPFRGLSHEPSDRAADVPSAVPALPAAPPPCYACESGLSGGMPSTISFETCTGLGSGRWVSVTLHGQEHGAWGRLGFGRRRNLELGLDIARLGRILGL